MSLRVSRTQEVILIFEVILMVSKPMHVFILQPHAI